MDSIDINGYKMIVKDKDVRDFIQEKVDSIIVAARLIGYDVSADWEFGNMLDRLRYSFIRVRVGKEKKILFDLIFHFRVNQQEMDSLELNFINSNGEARCINRQYKRALKKAEYLLTRS